MYVTKRENSWKWIQEGFQRKLFVNKCRCLCVLVSNVCFASSFALEKLRWGRRGGGTGDCRRIQTESEASPKTSSSSAHLSLSYLLHERWMYTWCVRREERRRRLWVEDRIKGCTIWTHLSPACNSRYEKTWESYAILVVNKSGDTCVLFSVPLTPFVGWFM